MDIMIEPNKGKKPVKYKYTLQDIAEITGYKVSYIYKLKQEGLLDPTTLLGVVEFLMARLRFRMFAPEFKANIKDILNPKELSDKTKPLIDPDDKTRCTVCNRKEIYHTEIKSHKFTT